MNTFLELVQQRQTTYSYDGAREVEKEKIQRILEAVRLSPSAYNIQPWRFIVVDDPQLKSKLADTTSTLMPDKTHFTKQAPIHIVVVQERKNILSMLGSFIRHKHFPQFDIGSAVTHLILAAKDEGLSTCIINWFDDAKVKKLLNIPSGKKALFIVTLGYSNEVLRPKKRKKIEDIVSYNKY
jgi:nitroreductase